VYNYDICRMNEMGIPGKINIQDYTYSLPEEKIAFHPLPERDASRLLIYNNNTIREDVYKNIADYLPENSLIVFNNTRVVNARIRFQKNTGGVIEVFCLEPANMEMSLAMQAESEMNVLCFIGGASKWKPGTGLQKQLLMNGVSVLLSAFIKERTETHFVVTLQWNMPGITFAEILHHAGEVPLPPYIKRTANNVDAERYQTIYALQEGSVAVPTAGLHFTPRVISALAQKNIKSLYVALHVGAGTFQPVKTNFAHEHQMHGEWIHAPKTVIESVLNNLEQPVTAVGTTSLRTLESIYWCGVKLLAGETPDAAINISQWEAYQLPQDVPLAVSFRRLLTLMEEMGMEELTAFTRLMIVPGYRLRVANGLITNFHQPQSTLLLLVAAVAGKNWKNIYEHALKNGFRFLSYGDGCLILNAE
jgi:S-adenosylmethionine:tRNA ribosyltransferase-isomerase